MKAPEEVFSQYLLENPHGAVILNVIIEFYYLQSLMQPLKRRVDCSHILAIQENNAEKGNLYLSSVGMLNQGDELRARKIDCILTVLDDWAWNKFQVKEKVQHHQIGLHHRIILEDDQESTIFPHLQFACQFIKNNLEKTNVLVHCQAGVSRSSSFVIAYLMKQRQMGFDEARKYAKQRRRNVSPNEAFQKQLRQWEEVLKKGIQEAK